MDGRRWIELGPGCSLEDAARVVAIIASYGKDLPGSARQAADLIADSACPAVAGGLIARDGDFELVPGCCCGLESWRDWYGVRPGGHSPWLGHDPGPYLECGSERVTLWPDEPDTNRKVPMRSLTVSYPEFEAALAGAAERMAGFVPRLEDWALEADAWSEGLAEGFRKSFRVEPS